MNQFRDKANQLPRLVEELEIVDKKLSYRKRKAEQLLENSGIGERFLESNFENYERKCMPAAFDVALQYAEKFDNNRGMGLIFTGNHGTGKTHLAAAIASHIIKNFYVTVNFVVFTDVLSDIRNAIATGSNDKKEPYNAFLIDEFKEWQEFQTNKNFGREYILSLIYYDKDIWMFGGIYKVLPIQPIPIEKHNGWKGWKYETILSDKASEYIGRAFFKFKKGFRASYPTLEFSKNDYQLIAKMPLFQILEKKVAITDFLGFNKINIDYKYIHTIINILTYI
jgi:hypothetical protein